MRVQILRSFEVKASERRGGGDAVHPFFLFGDGENDAIFSPQNFKKASSSNHQLTGSFFFQIILCLIFFSLQKNGGIYWVWPPHSNSDHQDYYIFSRGSL